MDKKQKQIEEKIIKVAIEVTKKGEGALFIIGENVNYSRLLNQKFSQFSIFGKGAEKVLKGLATIDGAILIDKKGIVKDYGVMIKTSKTFVGYGTRHAAAVEASKKDNTSILCSEEEKKVKIFKDGKYLMQVDVLEKGIEKDTQKIATMLETIGAGFIGTVGAATLAPALGITLLPGVIIFGGSYYAIKKLIKK